jgi:hypothetical protein
MSDETKCPKCNSIMLLGFIPDYGRGGSASFWLEAGTAADSWRGIPNEKIFDIVTYRCSGCGFLESYARK